MKIILKLIHLVMPLSIILAFYWAPATDLHGELSRIIFFHVPMAWISVLAFFVSGILSIVFLWDTQNRYAYLDEKAEHSALIGVVFTLLATVSGAIWAKVSWNSFWNWDPRQTSIVLLLLIYTAYFSLRSSLDRNSNKGKISSVYLVFAMATVPFFMFIVPRIYASLHPQTILNTKRTVELDVKFGVTLAVAVFAFTLLYANIFSLMNRITMLRKRQEEEFEI